MSDRRARVVALAAVSLFIARDAHAHLMSTGLGPFYDGALHLVLTPGDILPLVALSLYGGLRGPSPGRAVLFALPGSWIAGGLVGLQLTAEVSMPVVSTIVLIVAGLLVASDAGLPRGAVVAMAMGAGGLHGLMNGSAMAVTGAGLRGLSGIGCTAFVIVALLAALAVRFRDGWPRIALRVAGSWIVAIGLLMLGWTSRGSL